MVLYVRFGCRRLMNVGIIVGSVVGVIVGSVVAVVVGSVVAVVVVVPTTR